MQRRNVAIGYDIILENNQHDDNNDGKVYDAATVSNSSSTSSTTIISSSSSTNSTQKLDVNKIYICPAKRCGKSFTGKQRRVSISQQHCVVVSHFFLIFPLFFM